MGGAPIWQPPGKCECFALAVQYQWNSSPPTRDGRLSLEIFGAQRLMPPDVSDIVASACSGNPSLPLGSDRYLTAADINVKKSATPTVGIISPEAQTALRRSRGPETPSAPWPFLRATIVANAQSC